MRDELLLWVANRFSRISPATRGFALRRRLFSAAGVSIHPSAHVCGGVIFDNRHAEVGAGTWVGGGTRIIGSPSARVTVGPSCDLGPEVLLVVGGHEIGSPLRRAGTGTNRPITVGAGSWVGARSTILGGVVVGAGSVVAAGSLVNQDVTPDSLVGGVPARPLRSLSDPPAAELPEA